MNREVVPAELAPVDPKVEGPMPGAAMGLPRNRLFGAASVLTVVLLLPSCSSGSTTGSTPSSSPSASEQGAAASGTITLNGETANDHGTKAVSGGGSQEVEVDSFYFNPTVFTAQAGDTVTLTLNNEASTLHNFSLPDQNIDDDIPPGGSVTVTVDFPSTGTTVFFCKYHHASGMVGALQVA